MKLIDFISQFLDEESCKQKFKAYHDQVVAVCSNCGRVDHYWKKDKEQYECKHCKNRTTLKSGTVMNKSKLPFRYWFITMRLLTSTKKTSSAKEIQCQLGHNRYQPIWHMVHKLRQATGKRDDEYVLARRIELDEGYFSTETPEEEKDKPLKRRRGSQKKSKVLIMADSEMVETPAKGQKPHRVGYLKMKVIDDLSKESINNAVKELAGEVREIDTDDSTSYVELKNFVPRHNSQVIPKEKVGEVLSWVHIAISNAKRQLINTFHDINPEFLQNYLVSRQF